MHKPTSTSTAVAVDRIANIALDFTSAQQAANVAYDMTIEATGDCAQASDDYKAVMTAYHSQSSRRVVMTSVNTCEKSLSVVDPDWAAFCKRVDETDCSSQWADRGQDH